MPLARIPKANTGRRLEAKALPWNRSRSHLDFIRGLSVCLHCGKVGKTEAAHIRMGTDGALGVKPSDRYTVPLLPDCHARQHQLGEAKFWADAHIDPTPVAERLWAKSGDVQQAFRTIERAQWWRR